jgi:hypothetical protein
MKRLLFTHGVLPETVFTHEPTRAIFERYVKLPDEHEAQGTMPDLMEKTWEQRYWYGDINFKHFETTDRAVLFFARHTDTRLPIVPAISMIDNWVIYPFIDGHDLSFGVTHALLTQVMEHARCIWDRGRHAWDAQWVEQFFNRALNAVEAKATNSQLLMYQAWSDMNREYVINNMHLSETAHGDFGLENIILASDGGIRWIDLRVDTLGCIEFDIAKMVKSFYFRHASLNTQGHWIPHNDAPRMTRIVQQFCERHGYSWRVVEIMLIMALFRMSIAHGHPLGNRLFKWAYSMMEAINRYDNLRTFEAIP